MDIETAIGTIGIDAMRILYVILAGGAALTLLALVRGTHAFRGGDLGAVSEQWRAAQRGKGHLDY